MKFAIFEFEDCSCDIGETAWIYDENEELFDNSSWPFSQKIVVKWPTDFYVSKVKKMLKKGLDVDLSTIETQRFSAKVVKFGGKCYSLSFYTTNSCHCMYTIFSSHIFKK